MIISRLVGPIASAGSSSPSPPTESANFTGIGPGFGEQITDGSGNVWTIRLSDRTVMKNGSAQSQTNVQMLHYSSHIVWAWYGESWSPISGSSGLSMPALLTTPGLRSDRTVGPKIVAFTPTGGGTGPQLSSTAKNANITVSGGGLTATDGGGATDHAARCNAAGGTISGTAQIYFEATFSNVTGGGIGVANTSMPTTDGAYLGSDGNGIVYAANGAVVSAGNLLGTIASYTAGHVIGVAVSAVFGKVFFSVDGVFDGDPVTGSGGYSVDSIGDAIPACNLQGGGALTFNFIGTFAHAAPTGYLAFSGGGGVAEGVAMHPGDDLQSIVNANSAGTTYCLLKGTYIEPSIVPKDGDCFIGEYDGTTGVTLDGNATTAHAFSGTAAYVTIANLFVTNYASATQDAMIKVLGSYCLLRALDISACTTGAGYWAADHCLVLDVYAHANGQEAYKTQANDTAGDVALGTIFYNVELYNNNPSKAGWDGGEQGGGKSAWTDHLWHIYCYTHGNGGPGFWQDIDNIDTFIWYCNCSFNDTEGIAHEISWNASFIGNHCEGNGSSGSVSAYAAGNGIGIQNSGGVPTGHARAGSIEIASNTIIAGSNGRGMIFRQQDRGSSSNPYAPGVNWVCQNINVHDNNIDLSGALADSIMGMAADFGDGETTYYERNIVWDHNHYTLGARDGGFCWADNVTFDEFGFYTFVEWQGLGNDVHGDAH